MFTISFITNSSYDSLRMKLLIDNKVSLSINLTTFMKYRHMHIRIVTSPYIMYPRVVFICYTFP